MAERAWLQKFDERQQKQIEFSKVYASEFHHGADGHNSMMIIAKLAEKLDEYESQLEITAEADADGGGYEAVK